MLFSKEEEQRITSAIKTAERKTSGEIRLFVEDVCFRDHPVERAEEVFQLFGMFNTKNRNAVLIYLAEKSRHFAIWGDSGIHELVGFQFWEQEKHLLWEHLQKDEAANGVCQAIDLIGERLREYFPADDKDNENELPDEIIYG
ncbi:MAG: TPM domain-containing protein [Saprospiraceae bacterium]|nr:TPM domain-containing protein [Saprospiraceae bacterium]MCB9344320.1 TPM domain-containing protein [Lewinellaceae bacterium]